MKDLHKLSPTEEKLQNVYSGKLYVDIPCAICGKNLEKGDVYVGASGYERHLKCV